MKYQLYKVSIKQQKYLQVLTKCYVDKVKYFWLQASSIENFPYMSAEWSKYSRL